MSDGVAGYLFTCYSECKEKLNTFLKRYQKTTSKKLEYGFRLHETYWNTSSEAAEIELKAYDGIKALEKETRAFNKKIVKKLSAKFSASAYPKLNIILKRKGSTRPVLSRDDRLQYLAYQPVIDAINELGDIAFNLEVAIKEYDTPNNNSDKLYEVLYLPEKQSLKINDKIIAVGRGERCDTLLRAFFKNGRRNLLNTEICDADIYELLDGVRAGQDKSSKQKWILNGYRLLNDKVRKIVPNGEDLIVRIENGFVINPKLT